MDEMDEVGESEFHRIRSCIELLPETEGGVLSEFQHLAWGRKARWVRGSEIKIKFLNKEPDIYEKEKEELKKIVREWEQAANIHFTFVDNAENAPIRILFEPGGASCSELGTNALFITDQTEPTMFIGMLQQDSQFRRTVLHEFGHLLGCVHEHSHPAHEIKWDRERVMRYYKDAFGWAKTMTPEQCEQKIEKQVLKRYTKLETQCSRIPDYESIMMYPIPNYLLQKGEKWDVPFNDELSEGDKKFIGEAYPRTVVEEEKGVFRSWVDQRWGLKAPVNQARVKFKAPFQKAPVIAVGLNEFDLDCRIAPTITATTRYRDDERDYFYIKTETDKESTMYSSGVTWFVIDDANHPGFQTGTVNSASYYLDSMAFDKADIKVRFKSAFAELPTVVLWLKGFSLDHDGSCQTAEKHSCGPSCKEKHGQSCRWEVKLSPSNVTREGFTLQIRGVKQKNLKRVVATWIAYPSTQKNVYNGSLALPAEADRVVISRAKGVIDERKGIYERIELPKPKEEEERTGRKFRVYAAIQDFSFECKANLRLQTDVEKVPEETGDTESLDAFFLLAQTWNSTDCHDATVSYLVVYQPE